MRLDPIEGVLAVLNDGSAQGTNKYGILLALIELAPRVDEESVLTITQIAETLLEIHWDHARDYKFGPLRQLNSGNRQNTTVVLEALALRRSLGCDCPFSEARQIISHEEWQQSVRKIAVDTWRNPIRLLQKLPGNPPNFLYDIQHDRPRGIRLFLDATDALVRYGEVLRELIEFKFVRFVTDANKIATGGSVEEAVAEYLFGKNRQMPPSSVRRELWELQGRTCLYTGSAIADPSSDQSGSSVDHVIPWKRARLSAIENLVITGKQVNSSKGAILLAPSLLCRWATYLTDRRAQMTELALRAGWPSDLTRVVTVALAQYRHATPATPIWDPRAGVQALSAAGMKEAVDELELLMRA